MKLEFTLSKRINSTPDGSKIFVPPVPKAANVIVPKVSVPDRPNLSVPSVKSLTISNPLPAYSANVSLPVPP